MHYKEMKVEKILFITQEITPFVPASPMGTAGQELLQTIQDKVKEIRTFTPLWGNINTRRNNLHEVIRLSGMNLIIDDTDHPLIIKVASLQSARMQVYFIENEDYFHNRQMITDENGKEYSDNDERTIFFNLGVIEAVKKQRWCPEIIHCCGWMSSLVPLYIRSAYKDEPSFRDSKIVISLFDDSFNEPFDDGFINKVKSIMRICHCSIEDLKPLEEKKFLILFLKEVLLYQNVLFLINNCICFNIVLFVVLLML